MVHMEKSPSPYLSMSWPQCCFSQSTEFKEAPVDFNNVPENWFPAWRQSCVNILANELYWLESCTSLYNVSLTILYLQSSGNLQTQYAIQYTSSQETFG